MSRWVAHHRHLSPKLSGEQPSPKRRGRPPRPASAQPAAPLRVVSGRQAAWPCWLLRSSVLILALSRVDSDNDWYPPDLTSRFLRAIKVMLNVLRCLRSKILSIESWVESPVRMSSRSLEPRKTERMFKVAKTRCFRPWSRLLGRSNQRLRAQSERLHEASSLEKPNGCSK